MAEVGSWRDFFSSYPALDPYRDQVPEPPRAAGQQKEADEGAGRAVHGPPSLVSLRAYASNQIKR